MNTSPTQQAIPRGLEDVIVDETAICLADKKSDRLFYRGYGIEELCQHSSYEEVAYLLMRGDLPSRSDLAEFRDKIKSSRTLPDALKLVLEQLPKHTHPLDVLRTGCSVLGCLEPEGKDRSLDDVAIRLVGSLGPMLLYWFRFHRSGVRIEMDSDASDCAGHFLHLLHDARPDEIVRRALDVSLIVYAEHDFNSSTFAARVATSTLSDAYSAYVAAAATLRGPLHGSANAAVLDLLSKFQSPDEAEERVLDLLANKKRVAGFGQRAYSASDPRSAINKEWAKALAEAKGEMAAFDVYQRVEAVMAREKRMFANIDYYTALIYRMCGLPRELFPGMFFIARVCGLAAHIAEQRKNNRLIHPSSRYVGPAPRTYETSAD